MSQNLAQLNSTAIEIPHGWQLPKFQLGQPVTVRVWLDDDQCEMESGIIVGLSYDPAVIYPRGHSGRVWNYDIALNQNSRGWLVYSGILVAEEPEVSPAVVTDLAHSVVMTASDDGCELLLK